MATVVDSLVLELGIDPSKFTRGQKDALEALRKFEQQSVTSGKVIEAETRKTNEAFSALKKNILEIGGLLLAGMGVKEFTSYVTNLDAATGRASKTLNTSVQDLSAWQSAAEQAGGSAQGMTGAMLSTTNSLNTFLLTGQGAFLPVLNRLGIGLFNQNHQLKTAGQLYLDLAKAMEGVDPARARAFLSMVPGMNEDTINLLLRGRAAVESYLAAARAAGGTTAEAARAAAEYQRELSLLERAATSVGRTLLGFVLPALVSAAQGVENLLNKMRSGDIGGSWQGGQGRKDITYWLLRGVWGEQTANQYLEGQAGAPMDRARARLAEGMRAQQAGGGAGGGAAGAGGDHADYIRQSAIARGIDPNIALQVARSEGLGGSYVGDRGSSFGDFQLHYGGLAGGGMAVSGLGDEFTRRTGLDAKDPSTWRQQIDFALDQAKTQGWGAWHGWKGLPFAGIGGQYGAGAAAAGVVNNTSTSRGGDTNSTSIGSITIHTEGGDADSIAGGMGAALARRNLAAPFNTGQQ